MQPELIVSARDLHGGIPHSFAYGIEGSGIKEPRRLLSIGLKPADTAPPFLGFGGAVTESSAYVLSTLPPAQRDDILRGYFDTRSGHGYRFTRTHINSCDFSLESYNCLPHRDDETLASFTMERHERYVLPLLHHIISGMGYPVQVILSPWSPPEWMKTNGAMVGGGSLKKKYYRLWARTIVRFIEEMERRGIPVWGITPQNEPEASQTWESCRFTPEESAEFIAGHLVPVLREAGLNRIRILGLDHNRDILCTWADTLADHEEVYSNIFGFAFHWYSGYDSHLLKPVTEAYPGKPLVCTEACIEGGARPRQWDRGEIYARHIIGDLNGGASGWIDWNIALDSGGGPNHVGNFCDAPILVDAGEVKETGSRNPEYTGKKIITQSSYTYLGHFSRYIVPGSRLLTMIPETTDETVGTKGIISTASLRPDGTVIVIHLNDSEEEIPLAVRWNGNRETVYSTTLPARSIATWVIPPS